MTLLNSPVGFFALTGLSEDDVRSNLLTSFVSEEVLREKSISVMIKKTRNVSLS